MCFPDADVGALGAGRLDDAERERVGGDDDERAGVVGGLREDRELLDRAEEVRLLKDDRRHVVVERGGERLEIGEAVGQRDLVDRHAVAHGERVQGLAAVGVHAAADDQARAALAGGLREVRGGADGARPFVQRGV
jgi:hypothetical protein